MQRAERCLQVPVLIIAVITDSFSLLAVVRFAEPLALTSVFPYLPEMIKSFGIPDNNVAKWAGLVGSTFSVSQSLCAVPWGRLSDKIGRKPTILIGLINVMFCFILWGTSTSLVQAFVARFLMGLGNGNGTFFFPISGTHANPDRLTILAVGIIRTMVAEMVPWKELQPRAFSLMPLVWSVGSIFGPSFGGFFARPAQQYPALFGNSWLFNKYPFLLPNLVACIFFLCSVVVATLYLHETLETKRHERDWGLVLGEKISRTLKRNLRSSRERQYRTSFVDAEASAPLLPRSGATGVVKKSKTGNTAPPTMHEIFKPQVTINIIAYTFLALHSVAFDQVLPAFLDYPRQVPNEDNTHLPFHFSGGFGLNPNEIGTIFTVYGFACGVIQFFLFPPICSRFGALRCFKTGSKSRSFPSEAFTIPVLTFSPFSYALPYRLRPRPLHSSDPVTAPAVRSSYGPPPRQRLRRYRRLPLHHHPPHQLGPDHANPWNPQRLRHDVFRHRQGSRSHVRRDDVLMGREERLCDPSVLVPGRHRRHAGDPNLDDCRG